MAGSLQKEIRQKKRFRSAEEEAFLNLQRTADVLGRGAAEALKPEGLSHAQYNVLRILRGAGATGLACREIGTRMLTHDPDVTRLLDRLEARGLIARSRDKRDRRVITTRVTNEGRRVLQRLAQPVEAALHRQLGHLSQDQLGALIELLELARAKDQRSFTPTIAGSTAPSLTVWKQNVAGRRSEDSN